MVNDGGSCTECAVSFGLGTPPGTGGVGGGGVAEGNASDGSAGTARSVKPVVLMELNIGDTFLIGGGGAGGASGQNIEPNGTADGGVGGHGGGALRIQCGSVSLTSGLVLSADAGDGSNGGTSYDVGGGGGGGGGGGSAVILYRSLTGAGSIILGATGGTGGLGGNDTYDGGDGGDGADGITFAGRI